MATLLALAACYGGGGGLPGGGLPGGGHPPERVAIAALDARGFTLRVTPRAGSARTYSVGGGAATNELEVLAPFPRLLTAASDVLPLAMEMHRAAFASLGQGFKLRSGYYTEPVVVACRVACKSPAALLAASAALAAAASVAVLTLRKMR